MKALYILTAVLISAASVVFLIGQFNDYQNRPTELERSSEEMQRAVSRYLHYQELLEN